MCSFRSRPNIASPVTVRTFPRGSDLRLLRASGVNGRAEAVSEAIGAYRSFARALYCTRHAACEPREGSPKPLLLLLPTAAGPRRTRPVVRIPPPAERFRPITRLHPRRPHRETITVSVSAEELAGRPTGGISGESVPPIAELEKYESRSLSEWLGARSPKPLRGSEIRQLQHSPTRPSTCFNWRTSSLGKMDPKLTKGQ